MSTDQATVNQTPEAAPVPAPEVSTEDQLVMQVLSEEARLGELRTAIGTKVQAGENFDAEAAELAALNVTHADTKKSANAGAIADETTQIQAAFEAMLAASRLPELLGEAITSAIWLSEPGTGENGPVNSLSFNQKITRRSATTTTKSSTGTGSKRGKKFTLPDGTEISGRDVVLQYAEESVLNHSLVAHGEGKWVSKPEFIEKAVASAAAKGVVLTEVTG